MSAFRVLCTNPIHPNGRAILERVAEVVVPENTDAETLRAHAENADAIIVRTPLSPGIVKSAKRACAIVRHGVGLDYIPVDAATEDGIIVANVPAANTLSVVEHVVGAMLLLARRFDVLNLAQNGNDWSSRSNVKGLELHGKTVGIVGMGRIGSRVATACVNAFGMRVVAFDPVVSSFPDGCESSDLETVFSSSDFVTLHVPLTDSTRGMVDKALLSQMKPSAFLINAARGPLIRESDLAEALKTKRIAGAALDVFAEEPLPNSSPLIGLESVLLTPHSAALTEESLVRMSEQSAEEVVRVLAGEKPQNFVNPEVWERRRKPRTSE